MGFDIYISHSLVICKDTGRHFYYRGSEKVYDMPPVVPEEHREFIRMRGKVFRIYTNLVTDEMSISVEGFVENYPEWPDIIQDSDYEDNPDFWNEDKHNRFYTALKWFSEQNGCYMISWCY